MSFSASRLSLPFDGKLHVSFCQLWDLYPAHSRCSVNACDGCSEKWNRLNLLTTVNTSVGILSTHQHCIFIFSLLFLQFSVSEFLTCPLFRGQSKEPGRNRFPRPGRPCTKPRPHVASRPDSPPTAPDPAHFPTLRPITDSGLRPRPITDSGHRPRLLSVPRPRPSPDQLPLRMPRRPETLRSHRLETNFPGTMSRPCPPETVR